MRLIHSSDNLYAFGKIIDIIQTTSHYWDRVFDDTRYCDFNINSYIAGQLNNDLVNNSLSLYDLFQDRPLSIKLKNDFNNHKFTSTISPQTAILFSRLKQESQRIKENALEIFREKFFPSAPSRKNCMFFGPNVKDVKHYYSNMFFPRKNNIFKVKLIDNKLHKCNYKVLNTPVSYNMSYLKELCFNYWNGSNNKFDTEYLYYGQFILTRNI